MVSWQSQGHAVKVPPGAIDRPSQALIDITAHFIIVVSQLYLSALLVTCKLCDMMPQARWVAMGMSP